MIDKFLNDKNISVGRLIVTLMMLLIVVVGGTFAWLTYSSRQSALVLTIGDINDTQIKLSPYQVNGSIVPGTTYSSGVYSEVEVTKGNNNSTSFALFYKINQLDTTLIDKGLSYTIVNTQTGNKVKEGKFSDLIDTSKTLPSEVIILDANTDANLSANTSAYYRVYLWVDSSVGNQSDIQNSTLDVELNGSIGSVEITGYSVYGHTLTSVINDAVVDTTTTYSYQWYSNTNNSTTGGTPISGATSSTYTVGKGLVGKYIYVVVTSSKGKTLSNVTDSSNDYEITSDCDSFDDGRVERTKPIITFIPTSGTVEAGSDNTFVIAVNRSPYHVGDNYTGQLTAVSVNTNNITLKSGANSNVTVGSASVTVTYHGVETLEAKSNIDVDFTPSDTSNVCSADNVFAADKVDTTPPTEPPILISDCDTFTYANSTDIVGVTGYYRSTSSTAPKGSEKSCTSNDELNCWTEGNTNTTLNFTVGTSAKTYYVWAKDAANNVSASSTTALVKITRTKGDGTTLLTQYNSTSSATGTEYTSSIYVLKNCPIYSSAVAVNGYNNIVLKHNGTSVNTFGATATVNAEFTVESSATENTASITLNKDGSVWSNSGMNVALYSGTTLKYAYSAATATGSTVSWNKVIPGTYNVYASKNSGATTSLVDTDIDIVIAGPTSTQTFYSATVNYNTLSLNNGSTAAISAVTGGAVYLNKQTANINATVKEGYSFIKWTVGTGNAPASTSSTSTTVYVDKKTTLTATGIANTYKIEYVDNGGIKGANTPVSGTYDSALYIPNYTKTFVVNITNSGSGTLSASSVTKTQTFAGFTLSGGNTSTAKYGSSSSSVSTAWSSSTTKVKGPYFKNLTPTNNATVTLTAHWTTDAVTLPTIRKTGHVCGFTATSGGTTIEYISGSSYTPSTTTGSVTLYTICLPYTIEVTINKDGSTWNSSGMNVALYKGTTVVYPYNHDIVSVSGAKVTFTGVDPGTYNVYAGKNSNDKTTLVSTGASLVITEETMKQVVEKSTLNYYTLTVNKSAGISSVTGGATYLHNQTASISASVGVGYTYTNWTVGTGNTPASTTALSTTVSTSKKTTLTANARAHTYTVTYSYNGGTKGTNAPGSATYDNVLTINNPTKTFTVNLVNNSSGTMSASSASKAQTFAGWTFNGNTSTARYGTNSATVTTGWSSTSTQVTAQYFKNLTPIDNGTVMLTANWTPVAVKLPTITLLGHTCGYSETSDGDEITYASGANYTPSATTSSITLYAVCNINIYSIGYTYNGGVKGTNAPTSGTYDQVVTINNPTKTFKVNITNSGSGTLSASSVTKTQTFEGWTYSGGSTATAKYGSSSGSVTSAWSSSTTKVKAEYFMNLRSTKGTVTLIANWSTGNLTLPTITREGYVCGFKTTSGGTTIEYQSGSSYTPSTTTGSVTLYSICLPNIVSVVLNKDGSAWSSSGVNVALYSGTTAVYAYNNSIVSTSGSAVKFTGVKPGTYNVYASKNSSDKTTVVATGTTVTIGTSTTEAKTDSATLNYYTLTLNKEDANAIQTLTGAAVYLYNQTASISVALMPGYVFDKWTVGTGNTPASTTALSTTVSTNKKTTLTVETTPNDYKIAYSYNYGTKGTNAPTSATYGNVLTISNPTKTITVTGNVNGTGASVGTATSSAQTFAGWTFNGDTSTAKYGSSTSSVTTAWSSTSTKIKVQYFKNLTPIDGATVTLTANWTPVAVKLPTLSKTGYTCKWYTAATDGTEMGAGGASWTPSDTSVTAVTAYARCTVNTYTVGYSYNGGTAGTNAPTSATYDNVLTISNPTKTFVVNITNSGSGTLSATSATITQTFDGWTYTGGSTATAMYGTSTSSVTTSWSSSTTKVKAEYFKNLRSTSGKVTLNANWSTGNLTLPTIVKTGYVCGFTATSGGTTIDYASGSSYTPSTTAGSVRLYTVCLPNLVHVVLNKDGSAFSGSGINVALYIGTTVSQAYGSATVNGSTVTFSGVVAGIDFTVYAGRSSADKTLMISTGKTVKVTAGTTTQASTSATIDYYSLTLNKGTGISQVSGAGNYLKGQNSVISAAVGTGYTFKNWTVGEGNTPSSTSSATATITVNQKTSITANATPNTYTIGYTYNGGVKGTNAPTSATYDQVLTINNPSKTFIVNITNSASGVLSETSASSTQTFAGWTYTNGNTSTAKHGSASTSVSTSWSNSSTKVKNEWFKNLRSESGKVTLTANWTAVNVTLPTITKSKYICGYSTSSTGTTIEYASGASYTPSTTTGSVTLYTVCESNTVDIVIAKDSVAWSDSGMNIALYSDSTVKYAYSSATASGTKVTWNAVESGTYDIYASQTSNNKTTLVDTGRNLIVDSSETATLTYYTVTRSQGTGTTLTTRYSSTSGTTGTEFTNDTLYVLPATYVWASASATNGYNDVKLSFGDVTNPGGRFITGATTIASSATQNKAEITIYKSRSVWSNSGMNVALYSGTTLKYAYTSATASGSKVTWNGVAPGTYNIYAGQTSNSKTTLADTGVDIVIGPSTSTQTSYSASINYYTVTKNQGTGTTITTRYNSTSSTTGTEFTGVSLDVLSGTKIWVSLSLNSGYHNLIWSLSNSFEDYFIDETYFTVTEDITISSDADPNTVEIFLLIDGAMLIDDRYVVYLKNDSYNYTLYYSIDDAIIESYIYEGVVNGTYNIYVGNTDTGKDIVVADNNSSERVFYWTLKLNKGTGISSVSGGGVYLNGSTVTISAVASSGYAFDNWAGTGNMPVSSTSSTTTVTIDNSTTTLTATGKDNNKPTIGVGFTVNGSNYDGNWTKNAITATLTFSDSESGINPSSFSYRVKDVGGTFSNWLSVSNSSTSTNVQAWQAEGNRIGQYRICDNTENCNSTSEFPIKIDTTAPTATFTVTKSGQNITASFPSVTETLSGVSSYYYAKVASTASCAGYSASENTSYTWTSVSSGNYKICGYIVDNATNTSTVYSSTITITDNTFASYIENLYTANTATTVSNNGKTYYRNTTNLLINDGFGSGGTSNVNSGNIRYYGASPNNYVYFNCDTYPSTNCEVWRIVGVFTVDGVRKVKLIRGSSIGSYSWSGRYAANTTWGDNKWDQATSMTFLNSGYTSATYNNSLYYSSSAGHCSAGSGQANYVQCNFQSTGIKNETTRAMISNSTFYLGGGTATGSDTSTYANQLYAAERSSTVYSGNQTTWYGKVALPYASDYAYAMDFSSTTGAVGSYSSYKSSDWMSTILGTNGTGYFLNPVSSKIDQVYYYNAGNVAGGSVVYTARNIVPTIYLDAGVIRTGGTGTSSDPYLLKAIDDGFVEVQSGSHTLSPNSTSQATSQYGSCATKISIRYNWKQLYNKDRNVSKIVITSLDGRFSTSSCSYGAMYVGSGSSSDYSQGLSINGELIQRMRATAPTHKFSSLTDSWISINSVMGTNFPWISSEISHASTTSVPIYFEANVANAAWDFWGYFKNTNTITLKTQ